MKKNKIWIFIIVFFIIILYFVLRGPVINIINKDAVEKIVAENYPEYEIVDKNYMYLDHFWSTWYQSKNDDISLDIECNTTLKNKKTGMYVTIPFYHSKYGIYKENEYGHKNIKQLVNDYEKFWNELNDFSKKNGIEIYLSNAELTEAYNCDILELIIYIKEEKSMDSQEIINSIEKIDTNLIVLSDINYVVAKEKAFENFCPWTQSNIYELTLHNEKIKLTNDEQNYDFYRAYKNGKTEITWHKDYYIYN